MSESQETKNQIYEGPIATLKHFKDDVKEVKAGSECGMVFENFGQIQEGDLVEAHIMVEVQDKNVNIFKVSGLWVSGYFKVKEYDSYKKCQKRGIQCVKTA